MDLPPRPLIHLTFTGVHAGTYFCRTYTSTMGMGTTGERRPEDRSVHYAYAPEAILTHADLCPVCKAVIDAIE